MTQKHKNKRRTKKTLNIKKVFLKVNLNWRDHVISEKSLFRKSDIMKSYGNPSQMEKDLKWKANVSLDQIIEKLIERRQNHDKQEAEVLDKFRRATQRRRRERAEPPPRAHRAPSAPQPRGRPAARAAPRVNPTSTTSSRISAIRTRSVATRRRARSTVRAAISPPVVW